jgi:hypothetical protein
MSINVVLGKRPTGEDIRQYVDTYFCTCGEWVSNLQKDLVLLADHLGYEFKNEPSKRVLVKKEKT